MPNVGPLELAIVLAKADEGTDAGKADETAVHDRG